MPRSYGFTLVELLVTVSIISILAAIGMTIYSSVLKQGRDSKRQSDLRSIQSALEQYYADQFNYPVNINDQTKIYFGSKVYLNNIPTDPSGGQYKHISSGSTSSIVGCNNNAGGVPCVWYCLYARLENVSSVNLGNCPANGSYNFAVSPP